MSSDRLSNRSILGTSTANIVLAVFVGIMTAGFCFVIGKQLPIPWNALGRPMSVAGHGVFVALMSALFGLHAHCLRTVRSLPPNWDVGVPSIWTQAVQHVLDHENRFEHSELHEQVQLQRDTWSEDLSRRTYGLFALALIPALLRFIEAVHGIRVLHKGVLPELAPLLYPQTVGALESIFVGLLVIGHFWSWNGAFAIWLTAAKLHLDELHPPVCRKPLDTPPNNSSWKPQFRERDTHLEMVTQPEAQQHISPNLKPKVVSLPLDDEEEEEGPISLKPSQ